ncbi:MAG TPA: DUF5752 family protein [Bacteroidales bacterium]|nr:DUF5752 family protein [Bacteroidales bacterium]HSA44090.1 DUF5752 family protein [Bacteroidales bacterium]
MNKYEKKVAEDKVFYLSNGQVLSSLKDLYTGIQQMPDDVFFHHVSSEKNDFANWVSAVIGDKTLAAKVAKAGTPVMLKDVLTSLFEAAPKAGTTAVKKAAAVKKPAAVKKAAAPKAAASKAAASKAKGKKS